MKAGWQTKTLNQISENLDSRRIPITKAVRSSGEYPYYGASGIVDYVADFIFDCDALLVSEDGANLLARSTPIAFSVSGKYWVNNHAHILRFDNPETQRFVELYLESIPLDDYITGAAQPKLNQKALNSIPIPLPPLAEQRRIVGILDEAFEGLATAKANAEQNLQNARALFESHLQAVFTQRGDGWLETKMDDVTDLITCGVAKRPEYVAAGIPFLSAKNVKNGQVIWSGHQYVSEEAHRALTKNNKPKIGDILYTRVGSYGEAAIIDRDVEFSIFVSLTLIKPKPIVLNSFLKHYLNSSAVKELAAGSITGVGVGNLNVGTVREFPIHLPHLSQQRSIVAKLDDLREETQRLESLYQRKLAALDELKKSLLHRAFSGQL